MYLRFGTIPPELNGSRSYIFCSGVETDSVAVRTSVGSGPTCKRIDFLSIDVPEGVDGTIPPDTERPFKPNGTGGLRTPILNTY